MVSRWRQHRVRPLAGALSTAIVAVALIAPAAAEAGPLVKSAPNCAAQTLSRPFVPWLDSARYTLDRGGSFEGGRAGWSFNGASVVSGNEAYHVHGANDSHSLRLPSGSSATSSTVCVGLDRPVLRFFARNRGSSLGRLQVAVLFEDFLGKVHSLAIGAVANSGTWRPTMRMPIVANLLPLLPDNYTPVKLRFTPQGGKWRIDDVYIDPHHNG